MKVTDHEVPDGRPDSVKVIVGLFHVIVTVPLVAWTLTFPPLSTYATSPLCGCTGLRNGNKA